MPAHLDGEEEQDENGPGGDPHFHVVDDECGAHDRPFRQKNRQPLPWIMPLCRARVRGLITLEANYIRALASSGRGDTVE